ncbi:YcaO-like family protein [Spartinivicinus poritis]|uniref:YcaO-like family protein n=1 Tax=Spartinivicinus poritis TaxID=2994640 RepID=A0ABT5UIH0_9GAMM|nr:YcaO-like family protein [Spartinivicinus sp. A2-2]MDE1464849.1 YcaO-like family protein [Spartinivicinus sp. A2-2]
MQNVWDRNPENTDPRQAPDALIDLQDVPPSDPAQTIRRAAPLISPRTGIIRTINQGVFCPGDPECFSFGVTTCDISQFTNQANTSKAGGAGLTLEAALAATIGETAERYAMLFYNQDNMVLDSAKNLKDKAVAPALMSLLSPQQLAARPSATQYFDENTVIRWVWGYSLTHQCWRLVPASQVYMSYQPGPDEARIESNASSGLSASSSFEEATLSGLYEVIERDAFTIAWLHRRIKRQVTTKNNPLDSLLNQRFHASDSQVNVTVYDITLDIPVHCSWVVMRRPSEFGPVIAVGSAARLSPQAAMTKSILEIGQTMSYLRYLRQEDEDWQPASNFSDITSFDKHCSLYVKQPQLINDTLASLQSSKQSINASTLKDQSTGSVKGDLLKVVVFLAKLGYETIVVDITTADIAQVGLRVVRVIVPGLVPLHGNHNWPFLGVNRLFTISQEMGWSSVPTNPELLNPLPHPFP